MFKTIWERYFLYQFLRIFFLFLFCFYSLYVLIDYASHASAFSHHKVQISWQDIILYYFFVFASRAEILIPLSLLIALIHTLCDLNIHCELIALMAGGVSLKTLIKPFIFLGLISVFCMYMNEQWILPSALRKLHHIEDATKHQKTRNLPTLAVHHILLEDGSLFLFQNYDLSKQRFFDVYWIESIHSIYRMKYFSPNLSTGYFVDHLIRNENEEIVHQATYHELTFPKIKFQPDLLQSTLIDPDIFSLTELTKQILYFPSNLNEKESKVLTAFYWKIVIPWLCLITLIAPIPFCVKFSRQFSMFLIYMCSIFGLIAFYMFIDAAQVIAKRQVLSPFLAICVPFLLVFSYFGWRLKKL